MTRLDRASHAHDCAHAASHLLLCLLAGYVFKDPYLVSNTSPEL